MSRNKPSRASGVGANEGMLRHPDGSIDIPAYARLAQRERAAAIAFSTRETIGRVRGMLSAIGARLAAVVRSRPALRKHHAPLAR